MSLQEQQKHLLLACIATAIVASGIMYIVLAPTRSDTSKVQSQADQADIGPIKTPGATVQSNELWMQKISEDSAIQSKKLDVIEQVIHKQAKHLLSGESNGGPDQFTELKQEIATLKKQIESPKDPRNTGNTNDELPTTTKQPSPYSLLTKHELPLQGGLYTIKTRIPPGAYVKAVLLSAVDVGVGVNVSADPQPTLLRLLGEGHLPNKACSHLKRCHIVGSTVGDLSSERAFIRLEKMSCVDIRTGQIVETDVSGYVTGEDGKNGLAGVVVDRSGRMISSAVLVGLLSGVGHAVQSFATAKINESLASKLGNGGIQNNVMASDPIRNNIQGLSGMGGNMGGAGGGINLGGGAFDKLADYYIKRAEQLQPVIQINAGRVVHIVFTKGSNLGTETLLQAASSSTPKM